MRQIKVNKSRKGKPDTYTVRFREAGIQSCYTFDELAEAERFQTLIKVLTATEALAQLGIESGGPAIPTLTEIAARYIDDEAEATAGSRLTYHRMWARGFGPLLGTKPVNAIDAATIRKAVRVLQQRVQPSTGARWSAKTMRNHTGLLWPVLESAVNSGVIPTNPMRGIKLGLGGTDKRGNESAKKKRVILEPAQFKALDEVMGTKHYAAFIRFLYGMGCRYGEAVVVTVGDVRVDPFDGRTYVNFDKGLEGSPDNVRPIGNTKTPKGNREVIVPETLVPDLVQLTTGRRPGELLFTAPRGGPIQHRTFTSDIWYPALTKAGLLNPRPRIHDLRHTHITMQLSRGVPVEVVQERVGHQDINTTLSYRHIRPMERRAAADAADAAFKDDEVA